MTAAAETGGDGGDGEAGVLAPQGDFEAVGGAVDQHGNHDTVDAAEEVDDALVLLEGEVMFFQEFRGNVGVGELAAAGGLYFSDEVAFEAQLFCGLAEKEDVDEFLEFRSGVQEFCGHAEDVPGGVGEFEAAGVGHHSG